ncbi:MAG: succinylglutamate desuccinylase/aspartoacylase family protein [Alphaproteobacteria bacterium]|nr:succinylglutamate desuccinylase/aspartoacylase family protein [Alphaproteobacteria bacterium]
MSQSLHRLVLPSFRGAQSQHLPVVSVKGRAEGPRVAITANIHGDEATGIGAVHLLISQLEGKLARGEVLLYPSLNLPGLVAGTRTLPADGQDLNRQFPGDPRGTAAERHAHAIWRDLTGRSPDVVLDLHADSPSSIPYTLIDRASGLNARQRPEMEARLEELALASGLTVLHEYADDKYRSFHLDRSLSGALVNRARIPAVTIECGPRRWLSPEAVATSADAARGVLASLGMLDAAPTPHPTRVAGGPWRRASGPRASASGVLHPRVRPGEAFSNGQVVAEVRSLEGRCLERMSAPGEGYVISLPERTWITAGVSAGTYAVPDV